MAGGNEHEGAHSARTHIPQHLQRAVARILGFRECVEGRAGDPDCRPVRIEGPPRRHEAGPALQAFSGTARIADDKRKAVRTGGAPDSDLLDGALKMQRHPRAVRRTDSDVALYPAVTLWI